MADPDFTKLRSRLHHVFGEALGSDPACGGRVTIETINFLADEAVRACTAVHRRAKDMGGTVHVSTHQPIGGE